MSLQVWGFLWHIFWASGDLVSGRLHGPSGASYGFLSGLITDAKWTY